MPLTTSPQPFTKNSMYYYFEFEPERPPTYVDLLRWRRKNPKAGLLIGTYPGAFEFAPSNHVMIIMAQARGGKSTVLRGVLTGVANDGPAVHVSKTPSDGQYLYAAQREVDARFAATKTGTLGKQMELFIGSYKEQTEDEPQHNQFPLVIWNPLEGCAKQVVASRRARSIAHSSVNRDRADWQHWVDSATNHLRVYLFAVGLENADRQTEADAAGVEANLLDMAHLHQLFLNDEPKETETKPTSSEVSDDIHARLATLSKSLTSKSEAKPNEADGSEDHEATSEGSGTTAATHGRLFEGHLSNGTTDLRRFFQERIDINRTLLDELSRRGADAKVDLRIQKLNREYSQLQSALRTYIATKPPNVAIQELGSVRSTLNITLERVFKSIAPATSTPSVTLLHLDEFLVSANTLYISSRDDSDAQYVRILLDELMHLQKIRTFKSQRPGATHSEKEEHTTLVMELDELAMTPSDLPTAITDAGKQGTLLVVAFHGTNQLKNYFKEGGDATLGASICMLPSNTDDPERSAAIIEALSPKVRDAQTYLTDNRPTGGYTQGSDVSWEEVLAERSGYLHFKSLLSQLEASPAESQTLETQYLAMLVEQRIADGRRMLMPTADEVANGLGLVSALLREFNSYSAQVSDVYRPLYEASTMLKPSKTHIARFAGELKLVPFFRFPDHPVLGRMVVAPDIGLPPLDVQIVSHLRSGLGAHYEGMLRLFDDHDALRRSSAWELAANSSKTGLDRTTLQRLRSVLESLTTLSANASAQPRNPNRADDGSDRLPSLLRPYVAGGPPALTNGLFGTSASLDRYGSLAELQADATQTLKDHAQDPLALVATSREEVLFLQSNDPIAYATAPGSTGVYDSLVPTLVLHRGPVLYLGPSSRHVGWALRNGQHRNSTHQKLPIESFFNQAQSPPFDLLVNLESFDKAARYAELLTPAFLQSFSHEHLNDRPEALDLQQTLAPLLWLYGRSQSAEERDHRTFLQSLNDDGLSKPVLKLVRDDLTRLRDQGVSGAGEALLGWTESLPRLTELGLEYSFRAAHDLAHSSNGLGLSFSKSPQSVTFSLHDLLQTGGSLEVIHDTKSGRCGPLIPLVIESTIEAWRELNTDQELLIVLDDLQQCQHPITSKPFLNRDYQEERVRTITISRGPLQRTVAEQLRERTPGAPFSCITFLSDATPEALLQAEARLVVETRRQMTDGLDPTNPLLPLRPIRFPAAISHTASADSQLATLTTTAELGFVSWILSNQSLREAKEDGHWYGNSLSLLAMAYEALAYNRKESQLSSPDEDLSSLFSRIVEQHEVVLAALCRDEEFVAVSEYDDPGHVLALPPHSALCFVGDTYAALHQDPLISTPFWKNLLPAYLAEDPREQTLARASSFRTRPASTCSANGHSQPDHADNLVYPAAARESSSDSTTRAPSAPRWKTAEVPDLP